MWYSDIVTMHKYFIMKPNPYITNEEAQSAHTCLALGQAATILATVCLSLSLIKVFPQITQNSAFKKYTAFQFLLSAGIFGYYGYKLTRLKNLIPQQEFESRQKGQIHVVY